MLFDYPESKDLGGYFLFIRWCWLITDHIKVSSSLQIPSPFLLMGQRGQCLSDLVGFLMGHHIEDAFMFLSTVLLLLESHGAGFLKAVDLKSA